MIPLKHIPLKQACNFRDLGGYPTDDGRYTRWGILYRSDALSSLTGEDWDTLAERGVRTVIDLRGDEEVKTSPVLAPESVSCYHDSLMRELDQMIGRKEEEPGKTLEKFSGESTGATGILGSMKLDYGKTLFGNLECGVNILETITERLQEGAVVFMCSAGKDRTGIIAALLLYLCGVSREDIVADYMVSNIYNSNGINKKLSSLPSSVLGMLPDKKLLEELIQSRPETMIQLLDEFEAKDIRGCLEAQGFSREQQETLKARMTDVLQ